MEIVFVLVEPRRAENIGAAARALKAMGHRHLRLVAPCPFRSPTAEGAAYRLAVHSHDLLDGTREFADLAGAVADCDLRIGTTAKLRHHRHTALSPAQLAASLADKQRLLQRVALVFGPEDTGLTAAHLAACDILTTIALAAPQPSLNLAQAVMIYAHALANLPAPARHAAPAADASYAAVVAEILRAAQGLGGSADPRVQAWLRERIPLLPARDLRMLFNLLKPGNGKPPP